MTDDELFSSFKASGRFAAVLPGDRASGLRLSSPTQTLRPVTKTPSLAGVWIRVSVTVPVPQTEHSWSHVLFPVLDSWAKNPTGLTGGTCEMFQWKQDSTLPCFGLGANGIFLTNWPSKLFLMFKAAGEKIISPYSYPSDNTKIQHLPQFPNNCPELFRKICKVVFSVPCYFFNWSISFLVTILLCICAHKHQRVFMPITLFLF